MPYGNLLRCSLFALVLLLVAFGCNTKEENKTACNPTELTEAYKKITAAATGEISDATQIINFYNATNKQCHNAIAADVVEDLFKILYAHQLYDTLIIPFYDTIINDKSLSVQHRSRALLRGATFYLYGVEETKKALPYLEKAAVYFPEMNDTLKKGYYSVRAQLCMNESNLKEATSYYLKAIAICEKIKDSAALAATNSNFSTVYSRLGNYEKAAEMKKKICQLFSAEKRLQQLGVWIHRSGYGVWSF